MKRNQKISTISIFISVVIISAIIYPAVNAQYSGIIADDELLINESKFVFGYNNIEEIENSIPKIDFHESNKDFKLKSLPIDNTNWWNTEWPYRKLITIDQTKISNTLLEFPLLIYFSQDIDLANHAQIDGDDFVFIDYTDNISKLSHEIDFYDGGDGTGAIWINVPVLSSVKDTYIWMYYGNPSCSNQENIHATWNSDYVMIQHLNEESGTIYDSTINDNDGTSYGSIFNGSGQIDGAYEFDGINDYIDVGSYDVIGSGLTISMWFNADSFNEVFATSGVRLISKATGPETSDHFWMLAISDNGDKFRFRLKTENTVTANLITNSGSLLTNEWYYVTATYDEATMKIYRDSILMGSKSLSGTLAVNSSVPVWIGANPPNMYRPWNGLLDEIRVSQTARNQSWISTTYNNQYDLEGFSNISIEESYQYTLQISIDGQGTVTKNPDQITYEYGSLVILTAHANIGWTFSHWTGDFSTADNPTIINITQDTSVIAHFTQDQYNLNISIIGNGTVLKNPNQYTYVYGTTVMVSAFPDIGWSFSHWAGDITGSTNPTIITMTADTSIEAVFTQDQYILTINTIGSGVVNIAPYQSTYTYGKIISLTAIADIGWSFGHWSGDVTGSINPETIVMTGDKTVTATFTQNQYSLTINSIGNGSVEKIPDQTTYVYGTNVSLNAQSDLGWTFSHWSGDLTGTINPSTITISANTTINAFFTQDQYNLALNITGNGSVIKNPDQTTYIYGSNVTLTANPDIGWSFSYWAGDITGSTNPTIITMTGDTSIEAVFTQDQYTLTINTIGNGTVQKNPNQTTYIYGTNVTLTANPDIGWSFSHWTGDVTGSSNPIIITILNHTIITAVFTQNQYTLTTNIIGNGTLVINPDQTSYTYGTVVTLTAIADIGWSFGHWSGDVTGSINPETIVMTGDKTVTATFTQDQYILSINIIGNGTVTIDPNQSTYIYGINVTLTAIPAAGWSFIEWTGDITGTTNPITITIAGNTIINAILIQEQYTLTININGNGTVIRDPNQTNYTYGTNVTLTAIPDDGWSFSQWTGDLTGTTNPEIITITGDMQINAFFTQDQYTITLNIIGDGEVLKDPDQNTYFYGSNVTLTAIPEEYWNFSHWEGDVTGEDNPVSIVVTNDMDITAVFSKSDDVEPPVVNIVSPENAIYILNNRVVPFPIPVIIFGVTVQVEAYDNESDIDRVEFYTDGELKHIDEDAPYTWSWKERSSGRISLDIVAFDNAGNNASQSLNVLKWRFHPVLTLSVLMLGYFLFIRGIAP